MDGAPVEYTNWKEGEDTSLNDGKNCIVMVPELEGKWERKDCTEQAEVICQRLPGEMRNVEWNSFVFFPIYLMTHRSNYRVNHNENS